MDPLAVTAITAAAVPLAQLLNEVVTLTDPGLQPEASIVIEESAVVLVIGSRKLLVVFSAYQLITTAAPLAWPGTLRDVLFDDDETVVPVVRYDPIPH